MPRPPTTPTLIAATLFVLLLAPPAAADWLITRAGQLIETEGAWTVEGDTLTYTDLDGAERALPLGDVNLEASETTTALRAGRSDLTGAEASGPAAPSVAEPATDDEPKITLYMTTWCGYCRKARKLLEELDADFVAKDIEKSQEAAREFAAKSGGQGGIPLIDFDGRIVRGYSDRLIRQRVRELEQ